MIGYFVALGGSPVSRKTEKQTTASHSSAEAEYRAMDVVTSATNWICSLLASLHVLVKLPMKLFCDNQTTLHIAKNSIFHECTEHIQIDCHFIRECILLGELITGYTLSKHKVANILLKL